MIVPYFTHSIFSLVKKCKLLMHSTFLEDHTNNLNTQWRLSADDEQTFIKKHAKTTAWIFLILSKKPKCIFLDYYYCVIWVIHYLIVYSIICDYNIRVIFIIRFELLLLLFAFVPDLFFFFILLFNRKKNELFYVSLLTIILNR